MGLYEDRDISVSPVTDGPAGLVRIRHPEGSYEDRDISVSPVTDGPAGLVRTRRPVGAEMLPALQDGVRPLAGGLLDQVPNPGVLSSPTGSESDVRKECLHPVITKEGESLRGQICPSVVMKTMEPSKVKFSPEVLTNISEGSLVSSSVIPDPEIRTVSDNRTNIMKLDRIKEETDLSAVSLSSDSGMHSVDGEWDCMSTYSGESDSIQSVKTVYGGVCQTDRPVVKLDIMDSKGVMDTLEGQYGDQGSVPSVSTNGHKSDIADMGDFSDEEEEQWEEIEPPKVVHPTVRTEFVVIDHRPPLSTIGHNSDIADMGDFSDEDNEHWDDVEKSDDVQTEVRTDSVDSNSCARSELAQKPTVVIPHCMEIHDEEYWTNFRFQAKQAFKLDNVALAASDFPIAVKELVVKSRATMDDINDRAERQYQEEEEWKRTGKTVKPSFFYSKTDRLEDFSIPVSDWCRKISPIVDEEPTKTGFGPVTGSEEKRNKYKLADSGDHFPDPDARAKFDLSPIREDGVDVCSDPDARARFVLSPNKIDVCPDPDARAKFELSPTLEDGVDMCSDPDARAKFELSPTREDGIDMCSEPDARAKFELLPTMEDGVEVCSDPVVRSVHKSDYMSDPGMKQEGQEGCSGGPTITRRQYSSPSEVHGIDHPVNNKWSVYTSTGPMGFQVTLAGHITDWPDLVVPADTMKQSDVIDMLNVNRCDDDLASRSGKTEHPDDCSGDVTCTETTYDESDKLAGELDPLLKKDNGYQLVRVNGGLDNCLREICGSSDSGVQSWTEQWENMSDVSLIDSYDNTGNTLPEIPEEMSRLLFSAPPNLEAESDSDCLVTDSSVTDTCDSCSSESMSDEDEYGAGRKWEIPSSSGDFDSDIAVLSDFSDDSSIFGIRKVLRHRVPYRGRKPQFKHGFAPAPRTPPVKAKTHAERWQYEKGTTRAQYTRWLYGTPLDHKEEDFVEYVRYFTNICLKVSHDPRLDRYYPRLVRSLARAARVVQTLPHCRGNHRRRRDLMMRLFDDDMEQSDVARDRFPDRHVQKFTNRPRDKPESTKVTGTRTPPIYRNHHRKYAALRVSESDVDDYFGGAEEEWRWTVRGVTWYRPPPKLVRRRPRDD